VLARLQQHLLEIQTVGCLNVGALGDRHPRGPQPLGELVADTLELAQVEYPGIPASLLDPFTESAPREGGHERICELALELRDLRPQGAPRRQLVALGDFRLQDRKRDGVYPLRLLLEEIHCSLLNGSV
jgi:hypothetical protein